MRDFLCPSCGNRLAFENSVCLRCGTAIAFDLPRRAFRPVDTTGATDDGGRPARVCNNVSIARCNWLAPVDAPGGLCLSCRLTRTRPNDDDLIGLREFGKAESAKRRLVVQLTELGLPIVGRDEDPTGGLCFDLLSSEHHKVITGHANGVITIDLAEGDDVHREQLRVSMAEPYRTMLGHFRHEIGHYYYPVLAATGSQRQRFEELFGDPDASYADALERHYSNGAPEGWQQNHVSSYATMHPAEDWAETFAHYLHIRDTLDTAAAFGTAPAGVTLDRPIPGPAGFRYILNQWLPLTWTLNMVNRSMGHSDLYPFVLPPPVLEKMQFVHALVTARQLQVRNPQAVG